MVVLTVWVPYLVVAMGFCMLVVRPQIVRGRQLEARLEDIKSQYDLAQAAAKRGDQARIVETVGDLRTRVSDFSVEMEMAPDLVFEIAKLAADAGVQSFAMKPRGRQGLDGVPNCNFIGEKHIDLSFNSRFHRFAALLNTLERYHPVLFIDSFSINRSTYESSDPRVNMELSVMVEKPRGLE